MCGPGKLFIMGLNVPTSVVIPVVFDLVGTFLVPMRKTTMSV